MRKLKVAILLALVLVLSSFTLPAQNQDKKDKKSKKIFVDFQEAWVNEAELRHDAFRTAMPVYPEAAIKADAQGLFDAAVLFDEDGEFMYLKVLDSPHPAITKAVVDALKDWRIPVGYDSPDPATRLPFRTVSELRFHFVIRDGVGIVEPATPEEQRGFSRKYQKINGVGNDKRTS